MLEISSPKNTLSKKYGRTVTYAKLGTTLLWIFLSKICMFFLLASHDSTCYLKENDSDDDCDKDSDYCPYNSSYEEISPTKQRKFFIFFIFNFGKKCCDNVNFFPHNINYF